jgi:hypothetical protein
MSCANGLLLVTVLISAISFAYLILAIDEEKSELIKRCLIVFVISIGIIILIPSEKTCLAIIASQTITPDNLPTDMYSYIKDLYETCGRVVNNR